MIYEMHAVKCAFCDRLAFAPQYIKPAMCRKHHELVLMVSRLERQGLPATQENLEALYARRLARRVVAPEEVGGLLRDIVDVRDGHDAPGVGEKDGALK